MNRKTELMKKGYPEIERKYIKTQEDIDGIRASGEITVGALDLIGAYIKPGVSTESLNKIIHDYTIEQGGIPAPLNYHGFPKSICTSINEVICHGIPSEKRILKDGDIINVDVTTILKGYYADASRMYLVGEVSPKAKKLVQVAKECLMKGLEAVKPYEPVNNIGDAIAEYATAEGYSIVRDFGGHGVGNEFHEPPFVFHFKTIEKSEIMEPGMVFTIEPMINEGIYKARVLSDDWTAVTTDGKLSAQWEHTLVVTEDGYEILA